MKARECSLLIFGLTVASVLDSACEQRDLDVVELWSGVEAIVSAAKAAGLTAMPFDKFRISGVTDTDNPDATEDILLEAGFRRALSLVLRLRPGGLLWMAPVCSSWIFLNLTCTKRTKVGGPRFGGNLRYLPVRQGNLMAEMAAFFFLVAVSRGVHAVIENPASSMMFNYVIFANACCLWPKRFWAILPHCRFSTAPYGSRFGKKFKLMSSHAWVLQLACKCLCPGRKHKCLATVKTVGGKRTVTGVKQALKDSAAYPAKMGVAIIQAWMNKDRPEKEKDPQPRAKPRAKNSGPRSGVTPRLQSKVRVSKRQGAGGCGKRHQAEKTWASLDLNDSVASSSSSSRATAKRFPSWQALDIDDSVDPCEPVAPAGMKLPADRTAKMWRCLDLDESDAPPESQQNSHRWKSLSLDE